MTKFCKHIGRDTNSMSANEPIGKAHISTHMFQLLQPILESWQKYSARASTISALRGYVND